MTYYVYILASRSGVLYVGVTSNLRRRIAEHRENIGSEFTARYGVHHLLWFTRFTEVHDALIAEKRIKGWKRSRKIALIDAHNPRWVDLAEQGTLE